MDTPLDQSLSELTFYLYERAIHPELFNIYASRQFFQGGYEVIIWITGGSHVASIFAGPHCMTELICSPDQMLPERGLMQRFAFRGEKSHKCSWAHKHNYMMNFQVEAMSANLFRQTHADLTGMAKKRGMYITYPQAARNELVPFSYLDYEARRDGLQLHAFHAFPDHQTILKTQSIFDLNRQAQ